MLERNNVVIRDAEKWENDFDKWVLERFNADAKQYPEALMNQWRAGEKVLGDAKQSAGGAGKGEGKKEGGAPDGAAAAGSRKGKKDEAASSDMSQFYDDTSLATSDSQEATVKGFQASPRTTPADEIANFRSLERAYTQRLVLIVKDKATGQWTVPQGERFDGETMQASAQRWTRAMFGADSTAILWFLTDAPVGHMLNVFPPEKQQALQCYGEKVYFYRAEILKGRFRMPAEGDARSRDFKYSDYAWVTRDESEKYFNRPFYKYMHQVIGAGAGEEITRKTQWLQKIQQKGLSIGQATAQRSDRVQRKRRLGEYMPLVATQQHAALASLSMSDASKEDELRKAVNQYRDRVRESRAVGAQLRAKLQQRPMQTIINERLQLTLTKAAQQQQAAVAAAAAAGSKATAAQ